MYAGAISRAPLGVPITMSISYQLGTRGRVLIAAKCVCACVCVCLHVHTPNYSFGEQANKYRVMSGHTWYEHEDPLDLL